MSDTQTLLGEEAVDPRVGKSNRDRQNAPASGGEPPPKKDGEETLPVPVRSSERRAEAFLTEWLRRLARP